MAKRTNPDFLNGVPELLILRLLSREPMHGYQLVQKIVMATGKRLEFGEGSIYPVLHRLENDGCLASRETKVNGRPRVTYRTTKKGQLKLKATLESWQNVVAAIQAALKYEPE